MANNEPMTAARRAAIKARCDAATPGPWVVSSEYASGVDLGYKPDHERTWGYGCGNDFVCDLNDGEYHEYCSQDEQRANAEFIAAARQDIPDLLAEVERLRVENQRLEKSIDWLVSQRFPCPRDGSQCYKEIAIRNNTTYAENVCEQHWRDAALRAAMKEENDGNHE